MAFPVVRALQRKCIKPECGWCKFIARLDECCVVTSAWVLMIGFGVILLTSIIVRDHAEDPDDVVWSGWAAVLLLCFMLVCAHAGCFEAETPRDKKSGLVKMLEFAWAWGIIGYCGFVVVALGRLVYYLLDDDMDRGDVAWTLWLTLGPTTTASVLLGLLRLYQERCSEQGTWKAAPGYIKHGLVLSAGVLSVVVFAATALHVDGVDAHLGATSHAYPNVLSRSW